MENKTKVTRAVFPKKYLKKKNKNENNGSKIGKAY